MFLGGGSMGEPAKRLESRSGPVPALEGRSVFDDERPTVPAPRALVTELLRHTDPDATLPSVCSDDVVREACGVDLAKMRERYIRGEIDHDGEPAADLDGDVIVDGWD
jgi:hypothetical protein